ncbi:DNA primase large subunit PriL [Halobaculum lipolyticum]|uniref:DNA primase large subunit PriL n=1 Tax=Halobaculum lipolyticum TaxID=3032001 RepID=A0ABD5W9X6_9EURY|nr:DNA primase large subunit PriL [Halobaculum sp. DT31]
MNPRHARYPFFAAAREAVGESGVDLAALVADGDPAVERGRERIERALTEGTVEAADPREWDARDDLLSYPIARILVSLLDSRAAVEKYAEAEARTAYRRFTEDLERDDGARRDPSRIDRDALLREFDLADAVRAEDPKPGQPAGKWLWLGVGAYLSYVDADWGDDWRLVNRELVGGEVRIEREELYRLLREAVGDRVAEGLPFEGVSDDLAAELEAEIADLRDLLADRSVRSDIEVVDPTYFPPCLSALLDRARDGEELGPHARFSLLSFLAGLNLDAEEAVAITGLDPDLVVERFGYLRDESGAQYPPPSCRTLGTYGLCDNEHNHRSVAPHPLEYYSRKLREADPDDVTDWRDRGDADADGTPA